jgi:NDP-sugar pyrophosphorylase family protein
MEPLDIETLKKDPEFIENLKRLEAEMMSENSIAKGYQVLDAKLVTEAAEDDINEVFTFIVNTAFDRLSAYLTEPKKFDMGDPEDFATARAIYEHGIQRYSENDQKGAKEIFLVLYHMFTLENLKDAMMIHACAVMSGTTFEQFIEEFADVSEVNPEDPMAFFISTFVQPTDMLLAMWANYVQQGKEELKVLEENEQ